MKNRPRPRIKAFTIVESIATLAILAVLTMVVVALYRHEADSDRPTDATSVNSSPESGDNVSRNSSPSGTDGEKTE